MANLKREYQGTVYYDRFILGRWAAAEGSFTGLADSLAAGNDRFLWPAEQEPRPWRIHSVWTSAATARSDFRGNRCAAGGTGERGGAGQPAGAAQDTDVVFFAAAVLQFVETVFARWGEIHAVFCDSAEQVLKNSLRSACWAAGIPGWPTGYNSKKIEINDRIRLTSILMGGGRFGTTGGGQPAGRPGYRAVAGKHPGRDERLDDGSSGHRQPGRVQYTSSGTTNDIWG